MELLKVGITKSGDKLKAGINYKWGYTKIWDEFKLWIN